LLDRKRVICEEEGIDGRSRWGAGGGGWGEGEGDVGWRAVGEKNWGGKRWRANMKGDKGVARG